MAFTEAVVRDSLAGQLELIEEGMAMVDTEVHLPNAAGTRGFIDILAQDRLGNLVVIEVKRANQAARQALHEVLKYAELLQREHGRPSHRIRLVIASSHWDELRVPYSAFAEISPYALLGVELRLDEFGTVLAAEPARAAPPNLRGQISREQLALLWYRPEGRIGAWEKIVAELPNVGLRDMLGLEMDFRGNRSEEGDDYALVLVPGRMTLDEARAAGLLETDQVAVGIGPEELADGFDEDDAPPLESEALSRLMMTMADVSDRAEAFDPEKLVREQQLGWTVTVVRRTGVFARATYVSDAELVSQVGGVGEALNRTLVEVDVNPALRAGWDETLLRTQLVLEGNDVWQLGFRQWMTQRERAAPVDHHIHIYNLHDVLRAVLGLAVYGDPRFVDALAVTAGPVDRPEHALAGIILWDRVERDLRDIVNGIHPGTMGEFVADMYFDWFTVQQQLLQGFGLTYGLIDGVPGEPASLFIPGDVPERTPVERDERDTLWDFARVHLEQLAEMADEVAAGSLGYFPQG